MSLRVCAVQLAPQVARAASNVARAWAAVEAIPAAARPDLVVFPELALTGYNYASRGAIEPFLERAGKGPSFDFAAKVAARLDCVTVIGYPELAAGTIYNAAQVVSPSGTLLHNYRKTHLYDTDVAWGCAESPEGFTVFNLPIKRLGKSFKTAIGICMDLNPKEFKAPFEAYEFASAAAANGAELVVVPTAWMNSAWSETWTPAEVAQFGAVYQRAELDAKLETNLEPLGARGADARILYAEPYPYEEEGKPNAATYGAHLRDADARTGRYWIMRLRPLWDKKVGVVICNRSGMEDRLMYAGTSTVLRFNGAGACSSSASGTVTIDMTVAGSLAMATEGVLIRNI